MEKFLRKYYRIFFLGLTILLLYPTFGRGYIFLLDWMVKPEFSFVDIRPLTDSIGWTLFHWGAVIFSFEVFQRIFLFIAIYFLGLAGFRLAGRTGNVFAQYFAGLFLIFNPFMYARLVEQPGVALGSGLFFWFLVYFLEYLETENRKKLLAASFCAALSVSIFTHSVFFIGAMAFLLLLFDWIPGHLPAVLCTALQAGARNDRREKGGERRSRHWKFFLKTFAVIFGIIIVFNANWLFSFARGSVQGVGGMQNFSLADAQAFRTRGLGGNGVYFTVLSLQGYWGEYQDRFVSIRENPLWAVAFWIVFILAIFGLIKQAKNKDPFSKPILVAAVVAYGLAIGVASPIFAPLANFLYAHFPLYIGLRESQKWVVILVFFYAYFGSWGVAHFLKGKKLGIFKPEWSLFFLVLPIIFSFPIIKGMHQHFTPHEFPPEWQEAKAFLKENPVEGKIVFFPWHLYAKLDFAGKNIAVPAQSFFGKNVIQGNNTEFGGVYSHSLDPQTLAIEKYVIRKYNPQGKIEYENFVFDMEEIGVGKIMLAKTEDWQKYLWLDRIKDVEKVLENDKLIIYEIKSL